MYLLYKAFLKKICVLYAFEYVGELTHVCICPHSSLLIFEAGSLTEHKFTTLARHSDQQVPVIHVSLLTL